MKVLELFAGSRSIWKVAEKLWYEVFSVDYKQWGNIDLVADIYTLKKEDIPFIPDIIWASPDCTTYSIAACKTHRFPNKKPRSLYAEVCDKWNRSWLEEMSEYLDINPNTKMFIENPRWNFRHMEFIKELEEYWFRRHTIWYCQYWDKNKYIDKNWKEQISIRAKPTDIWSNSRTWTSRPECHNYKYNKETWEIINRHCNHDSARRWSQTGTQWLKNAHERSKIPKELCLEILKLIWIFCKGLNE